VLPLEIIKKYYPYATEDELKDIQEVVYLLACAVMQEFYGPPSGQPRRLGGRASPFWRVKADGKF